MIVQSFRRAFSDTLGHVKTLIGATFAGVISLIALYSWKGRDMALDEIPYVVVALFGAGAGVFLIFVWNLIASPYRIERNRADAADKRVSELETGTVLPNTLISSLDDYRRDKEALESHLLGVAMLFEGYHQQMMSVFERRYREIPPEDKDVKETIEAIYTEAKKILPRRPFSPLRPLIIVTGWNQYRYIFNTPMAATPDVSFPDMPKGISAELLNASRTSFEVRFWNHDSQNENRIEPQGYLADTGY